MRTVAAISRGVTLVVAAALAVSMAAPGAGAHDDGTTGHLWLDHIKPMKQAGTINESTNPVDWTKLKNVPAGIADGTDDGVELAGFGLRKAFGIFFVDVGKIQRRVTTTCAVGQSIRAIAQDGTAVCDAGPKGLAKTVANTGIICNAMCTEGTLTLANGTWAITAKIEVDQDASEDRLWVDCELHAGGLIDRSSTSIESSFLQEQTIPMQLVATLSGNVNASVNCQDHDLGDVSGRNLSIMAIRVSP